MIPPMIDQEKISAEKSVPVLIPRTHTRIVLDSFRASDCARLETIAFLMNERAKNEPNAGVMPFYAFQLSATDQKNPRALHEKVEDYLFKAAREKQAFPRSTYRLAIRNWGGVLLGGVCIDMMPVQDGNQTLYGDLGYFIDPMFSGNGFVTEACVSVLNSYFDYYPYADVTAHPKNKASCKIIEKMGGVRTGIKISHYGSNEPRACYKIEKFNFMSAVQRLKEKEKQYV